VPFAISSREQDCAWSMAPMTDVLQCPWGVTEYCCPGVVRGNTEDAGVESLNYKRTGKAGQGKRVLLQHHLDGKQIYVT
jgi:hypothetical protein